MTKTPISEGDIRTVENYLKMYRTYSRLLRVDRYERDYLGFRDSSSETVGDGSIARAKMYEIRHFIMDLPNSDEKLLLYCHYVRGESMEKCAELLGISRAGAYRMKKRALSLAFERL